MFLLLQSGTQRLPFLLSSESIYMVVDFESAKFPGSIANVQKNGKEKTNVSRGTQGIDIRHCNPEYHGELKFNTLSSSVSDFPDDMSSIIEFFFWPFLLYYIKCFCSPQKIYVP